MLSARSRSTLCSLAPSHGRRTVRAAAPRRLDHGPHHAGRNGEADAVAAAGAREDRRVDADQAPADVDERAAGIARIDGRVGLDEELIVGDADLRARQRRDDALRDGLADAERIADGENEIADLELLGIAELDRRQRGGALQAEHGKVGALVAQHDLGLELAPVGERHLHLGHVLDDVVVRDDEPGGVDDHPRAEGALHALARHGRPALAEEAAEEVVHGFALAGALDPRAVDVDDRRSRPPHDRREGKLHLAPALGRGAGLGRRLAGIEKGQNEGQDQVNAGGLNHVQQPSPWQRDRPTALARSGGFVCPGCRRRLLRIC